MLSPCPISLIFCAVHQPKVMPMAFKSISSLRPDLVIWCDNKYEVNEALVWPIMSDSTPQAALWMFRHPFLRGGAGPEFAAAVQEKKYAEEREQMEEYLKRARARGVRVVDPARPHYAAGVLVWDMRHATTLALQSAWYQGILECGVEDQVSLHVVLQQFPACTVQSLPGAMVMTNFFERFESFNAFTSGDTFRIMNRSITS